MPKFFLAGYWIVDWKGVANHPVMYAIVTNNKCWIWFAGVEDTYPAQRQGYTVHKIILGSETSELLNYLKDELKDIIEIRDWHIPSEEVIRSCTDNERAIKAGQIPPHILFDVPTYDKIMDGLRHTAQRNEDLTKKLSQTSSEDS
jgi:hypothetical protein